MIDKVAWIVVRDGRILSTRNHGLEVFYLPGGKREAGETDVDTLTREIKEELTVDIIAPTMALFGTFTAPAHGRSAGILVQMTCYTAEATGDLAASHEIAEYAWLSYADRGRVSATDQLVFDHLHALGELEPG